MSTEKGTPPASSEPRFHPPIWDRGEPIDAEMMAFTIGDDWLQDARLVEVDIQGSLAHVGGLGRAGLISEDDRQTIQRGLETLLVSFREGGWAMEPGDEDVHSAVERRLIQLVGDAGKRLHTGRSRNDQVALDMRLWLRSAVNEVEGLGAKLLAAFGILIDEHGALPLPGYTHLRRAMPSTLALWAGAHAEALRDSLGEFELTRMRIRNCPLGSGAGYGIPLPLDRKGVAQALGFEAPEEPVTLTQHVRGRAELAYLTALEGIALDLGKLAADLWLFTSSEFGFTQLPVELSTGSSLMPHKRNPDLIELIRAHSSQVVSDRAAVVDLLRDLPLGYHRDFQLLKPPLFRAHDRIAAMLPLVTRTVEGVRWNTEALKAAAADPKLTATERTLDRVTQGESFRDAYREESRGGR
ncbi:MAG: argininosuccinate lyase [Planctomycetota bacterium]|jgi:argininosuccinate lyase